VKSPRLYIADVRIFPARVQAAEARAEQKLSGVALKRAQINRKIHDGRVGFFKYVRTLPRARLTIF
jgi:hypothetical protein